MTTGSRRRAGRRSVLFCAAVMLSLVPPATVAKTHCFPLSGGAPEDSRRTTMEAIAAAIVDAGGDAVLGETRIDDTALVLGCGLGDAECRKQIAGAMEADEVLYGSLEGTRLALTLVGADGEIRSSGSIDVSDGLAAVAVLVATLYGRTLEPPPDAEPPPGPGTDVPTGRKPKKPRRKVSIGVPAVALVGAGVVFIAAGAVLGVTTRPIRDDFTAGVGALPKEPTEVDDLATLTELDRLRKRGETRAVLTNVSFYVGGAAFVAGVTLGVLNFLGVATGKKRPGDDAAAESEASPALRVGVGHLRGGAMATAEIRW